MLVTVPPPKPPYASGCAHRPQWLRHGPGTVEVDDLTRCNGSYVSADWRDREDDIIWRLKTADGELYLYLLLEFQATIDRDMALRILVYAGLLWQDLRKTKQIAADAALPPILPIVLYNGETPWSAPTSLKDLLAPYPATLERFKPDLRFLLMDEVRMDLSPFPAVRNLAAAIFRLEQTQTPEQHYATGRATRGGGRGAKLNVVKLRIHHGGTEGTET